MFQYAIPKLNRKLALQESKPGSEVIVDEDQHVNIDGLLFQNVDAIYGTKGGDRLNEYNIPTKTGRICRYWHGKVGQK